MAASMRRDSPWLALVLLTAISTVGFIDRIVMNVLAVPIQAEFRLSDTQVGLLTGLAFAVLNVARVRELFEQGLDRFGGPWLAGPEFTAADAFYAPVAFRVRTYGLDVGRGQAWVERVIAHPAMQYWEKQALAETWREASHEAELAAAGTITADYRQR